MKYIAVFLLLLVGCTSSDEAFRALESQGYKNISITGYKFFGCDDKDTFHTGWEATGVNGKRYSGVVCSGWLKNATVRVE